MAVTDHDHYGLRFLDRNPELWAAQQRAAGRHHAPGRFVTFPAFEWTNWLYGHRHVLYVGEPGPVFSSLDEATLNQSDDGSTTRRFERRWSSSGRPPTGSVASA